MSSIRKKQIHTLLKGIETGDPASVSVINPEKYIQHNPQTHEGRDGLAALFKRLSESSPRVNVVRIFSDGDFVFGHTEYDFSSSRVGFEIFRFEGEYAVEHWDNIQSRQGPNLAGHSMVDGVTEAEDIGKTELNRELVNEFVNDVLIDGRIKLLSDYIDGDSYTEHNPRLNDTTSSLFSVLSELDSNNNLSVDYQRNHRILADGNFVLSVCEGYRKGNHSSFYDLFRIGNGRIIEHWDTTEKIPAVEEWKNENGKF